MRKTTQRKLKRAMLVATDEPRRVTTIPSHVARRLRKNYLRHRQGIRGTISNYFRGPVVDPKSEKAEDRPLDNTTAHGAATMLSFVSGVAIEIVGRMGPRGVKELYQNWQREAGI